MIDKEKSVVILTHPRSGSTWFQNNLVQKNLHEFFNWKIFWVYGKDEVNYPMYDVDLPRPSLYFQRIKKFKDYQNVHGQVSAKLFTGQYVPELLDFFTSNTDNIQFIHLSRKNLHNVIWSYCISATTNIWKIIPPHHCITIPRKTFDTVIFFMELCFKNLNLIKTHIPVIEMIYEDALSFKKSDWWRYDNTTYIIQNLKNHLTIENKEEVNNWILEYNMSNNREFLISGG